MRFTLLVNAVHRHSLVRLPSYRRLEEWACTSSRATSAPRRNVRTHSPTPGKLLDLAVIDTVDTTVLGEVKRSRCQVRGVLQPEMARLCTRGARRSPLRLLLCFWHTLVCAKTAESCVPMARQQVEFNEVCLRFGGGPEPGRR